MAFFQNKKKATIIPFLYLLTFLLPVNSQAQLFPEVLSRMGAALSFSDLNPRISLVTCGPGSRVYELYGHSSIRIEVNGMDIAINYGLFDFDTPNFAYRFVSGQTDYLVDAYPMALFMREYHIQQRRVICQELNLTQPQAKKLYELILENIQPENHTYRYNYVKENCATKIVDIIEKAIGDSIRLPRPRIEGVNKWSFRDEMRYFNDGYPWYDFGIDLVLGNGIDYPLSNREKAFTPMALSDMISRATITDSLGSEIPLIKKTSVVIQGQQIGNKSAPTPFLLSPIFVFSLLLLTVIIVSYRQLKRRKLSHGIDVLLFLAIGLAGLLLSFLIFFSTHEATSPNYLFLIVNPLAFIAVFPIFRKRLQRLYRFYHVYNLCAMVVLFPLAWFVVGQVINIAFYPIALSIATRDYVNLKLLPKKTK